MIYFELAYFTVFLCSALGCAILLLTDGLQTRPRAGDIRAVQSSHDAPRLRIGGAAIHGALLFSLMFAPNVIQPTYVPLLITLIPVFVAGLCEDLGCAVSPRRRLAAAALSSVLAIMLLGSWVVRADVPGMDYALMYAPVALCFTVFATTGVCHAFNLIDGLNGLSAGTGVITALGLATIAHMAGHADLASLSFMVIAALMGFLVFNFPGGRIFLGDAGAYALGHILAWISVVLMFRAPDVTPWAVVLVFFWPLMDTLFAILRRRRSGRPTAAPDRLHFHQLTMRYLEIRFLGRGMRRLANPLATLVLLPFIAAPVLVGVIFWNAPVWAFVSVVLAAGLFIKGYGLCLTRAQCARTLRLRAGPADVGHAGLARVAERF